MAELELHGYLTTGKFYVNDYVIEIERVTEGLKMTVTDNNAGTVKSVTVLDGEAGMTEEEIAAIKETIEKFKTQESNRQLAESEREIAEKKRVLAETLRDIAENGAEGETDQTAYRAGLYKLMKELYEKLSKEETTLTDLEKSAKKSAESAAASATEASKSAAKDYSDIFFTNDEEAYFKYRTDEIDEVTKNDDGSITSDVVTNPIHSRALCGQGYVTDDRKTIHIKIPFRKSLLNVTAVTCTAFKANICNNGGYGIQSSYTSDAGADYLDQIANIIIDKVQNCLHIVIKRSTRYDLTNNDAVSCRAGEIRFKFTAPVEASGSSSSGGSTTTT